MSFKKNKYTIIRNAISKDLATFCYNYLLMKKQVYDTCVKHKYISPFEKILGFYELKEFGAQVPNTYCNYSDIAMETLLLKLQPIVEKETNLKLYPNYTYSRNYSKGDELLKHIDRSACEISTTLNLGGDTWPIYLEPKKGKSLRFDLEPGDMMIYKGKDLYHWREPFQGDECVQVFLHYSDIKSKAAKPNIFDTKIHLGLPSWFKDRT